MTGLWQVTARAKSTFGEALDMDVEYVRGWSLSLDLRLLLQDPVLPTQNASDDMTLPIFPSALDEPVSVGVVGLGYWGPNLDPEPDRARLERELRGSATSTSRGSTCSDAATRA